MNYEESEKLIKELKEAATRIILEVKDYDYQGQRDFDISAADTAEKALKIIGYLNIQIMNLGRIVEIQKGTIEELKTRLEKWEN